MTVGELCAVCRNWFVEGSVRGRFSIREGVLGEVPGAAAGQFIRLIGSTSNDGVYRCPAVGLKDEEFEGAVWLMAPPPGFVALAREIDAWEKSARRSLGKAVENAVVLEEVAKIAALTVALNPSAQMNPALVEKHYSRKHGPNAYYGQIAR